MDRYGHYVRAPTRNVLRIAYCVLWLSLTQRATRPTVDAETRRGQDAKTRGAVAFASSRLPVFVLWQLRSFADGLLDRDGLLGPNRLLDLLDQLQLDVDLDLIADQPAAGLERHVPIQAPLLAADLSLRIKPGAGGAPRRRGLAGVLDVQRDGLGHVADGQIAVQLAAIGAELLDTRALERNIRVGLDVEEIRRAQVPIALLVAGHQAGGLDPH